MQTSVLTGLLDANQRFALDARGTTNHLPMALVALSRIGASDRQLEDFFRGWETNRALPRVENALSVNDDNWARYVGDSAAFDALSGYFRQRIAREGIGSVVQASFPALQRGAASNAFHSLIRLAYAIECGHPGEAAAGLASLTASYLDLGEYIDYGKAHQASTVNEALARLSRGLHGTSHGQGSIVATLKAVAADPRFSRALLLPPLPSTRLLGDLASAAIALYWQTANFTVLHMVTFTHAARVIFSRYPALLSPPTITALWTAYCAAYAAVGAPPLDEDDLVAANPGLSWPEIFAAAAASRDDHVIKMVYTCSEEERHYGNRHDGNQQGNRLYQAVASRLVLRGEA